MKELTLVKKIEFCELYLKVEMRASTRYICNRFYDYYHGDDILNTVGHTIVENIFKIIFPELYKMIMKVGKDLIFTYEYICPWPDVNINFRKQKIQELLNQLKK